MRIGALVKILLGVLLTLITFGCQTQPVSNSSNTPNTNVTVNSVVSNNANQTLTETKLAEPQTVTFESADKLEIVGTFYESPKANSPAVLLLHQWMMNRKSYDEFANRLQKDGFGVLAIDGRGFGESVKTTDGKEVKQNPEAESLDPKMVKSMMADVDNAFQFLAKQKNVDAARIGVVGASYGSSLAAMYAGENPKVKAVALLSPGINYFDSLPIEPALKNYGDKPVLLVAANDDKDSAEAVEKLKSAHEKYEVKIYEKGGHGTKLFEVGLQDSLEQFLKRSL